MKLECEKCAIFLRQADRAGGRKRMKTKKLLKRLLTICFLTVIFAACQQNTQTELIPTPNAQTNQFTVSQAWSSVGALNPTYFYEARWRNNHEVYLAGGAGVLWSTDTLATKLYVKNGTQAHGFYGDWKAEWNLQGTQLLSSDFVWDAELEGITQNDHVIPNNPIIINSMWQDSFRSPQPTSWSPNGQKVAFGTHDYYASERKLRILDTRDRSFTDIFSGIAIDSLDWVAGNQILINLYKADYYQYFEIINIDTRETVKSIRQSDLAIQYNLNSYGQYFISGMSKDFKKISIGNSRENKLIISIINGQDLNLINQIEVDSYPRKVQWLSDGKTIAILCDDYSIRFINTETKETTKIIETFQNLPYNSRILNFQYSLDEKLLILINARNEAILYDSNTMEIKFCYTCHASSHNTNIYQVILNLDNKTASSVGRDSRMIVHTVKEGASVTSQKLSQQPIYAIANSPDGNVYATSGEDGVIHLWDSSTRAETGSLTGHTYNVRALSWKPNSPTLASAGWDDTVRLWDTSTQTLTATLTDHTNYVNAVQYNPSGTELASASSDGTIKLRNPDTGETLHTLLPADSSAKVFTIAYSSDGTHIASGSDDHRVRIWNTQTQTLEATLTGHLSAVRTVIWLNPTTLVTGGMDGRIIFWDTTSQQMIQELKPNLGAVFTITATADGTQLFAGFDSGNIVSWKVSR
jgi:WD40 repeat protein